MYLPTVHVCVAYDGIMGQILIPPPPRWLRHWICIT